MIRCRMVKPRELLYFLSLLPQLKYPKYVPVENKSVQNIPTIYMGIVRTFIPTMTTYRKIVREGPLLSHSFETATFAP